MTTNNNIKVLDRATAEISKSLKADSAKAKNRADATTRHHVQTNLDASGNVVLMRFWQVTHDTESNPLEKMTDCTHVIYTVTQGQLERRSIGKTRGVQKTAKSSDFQLVSINNRISDKTYAEVVDMAEDMTNDHIQFIARGRIGFDSMYKGKLADTVNALLGKTYAVKEVSSDKDYDNIEE